MSRARLITIGLVAAAVFVLDRITKQAVIDNIPVDRSVDVVGPYVRLTHVRNTGMAFGLAQDRSTLLALLSVAAVVAIVYYYRTIASTSPLVAITLGMQLGGAFGNLVDRVAQGYVVDFVDVGFPQGPRFWAFNVADSSIVVGILAVSILLWVAESRAPRPA